MTDTDTADQVKRLRIKSDMLRMGEPIAFGSDADALGSAADIIERLTRERDEARVSVDKAIAELGLWARRCGEQEAHKMGAESFARSAEARIAELTRERDEATRWTVRFETDLNRTMLALGDRFTLALPDGGDVHPHEAAKAAIDALAAAEARIAKLEAALKDIARQKLIGEMDDPDVGCFEEGYEGCVLVARTALEGKP
jgi:hypothetical protein